MRRRVWGLVLIALVAACGTSEMELSVERAPDAPTTTVRTPSTTTSTSTPTSTSTTTSTTVTSSTSADATPPSSAAPTTSAAPAAPVVEPGSIDPYRGLGAWLDRYDWSVQWAGPRGRPVGPEAMDHLAAEGVQTLYLQTSYWEDPVGVIEPQRLRSIVDRAHHHGIAVVGWYLPAFVDPGKDLQHILAMHRFGVDGVAIDIEGTQVKDVPERSRRLVALSKELRRALPGLAIGGIVLEPVLIEDLSSTYWPDFPWEEIAPYYDVWMPMNYWTNRVGEWRSAYRYMTENITRVRANLGLPHALVHPIGGVGDKTSEQDLREMVRAASEHAAIGGSIYDYATSRAEFWPILRSLRTG